VSDGRPQPISPGDLVTGYWRPTLWRGRRHGAGESDDNPACGDLTADEVALVIAVCRERGILVLNHRMELGWCSPFLVEQADEGEGRLLR